MAPKWAPSRFDRAVHAIQTANVPVSDTHKLLLYGLFKQSTVGPAGEEGPSSFLQPVAAAKWEAWSRVSGLTTEEAMERYAALVEQLLGPPPPTATSDELDFGSLPSIAGSIKHLISLDWLICGSPRKPPEVEDPLPDAASTSGEPPKLSPVEQLKAQAAGLATAKRKVQAAQLANTYACACTYAYAYAYVYTHAHTYMQVQAAQLATLGHDANDAGDYNSAYEHFIQAAEVYIRVAPRYPRQREALILDALSCVHMALLCAQLDPLAAYVISAANMLLKFGQPFQAVPLYRRALKLPLTPAQAALINKKVAMASEMCTGWLASWLADWLAG